MERGYSFREIVRGNDIALQHLPTEFRTVRHLSGPESSRLSPDETCKDAAAAERKDPDLMPDFGAWKPNNAKQRVSLIPSSWFVSDAAHFIAAFASKSFTLILGMYR